MFVVKRVFYSFLILFIYFLFPNYCLASGGHEGEPIPGKVPLDKLSGISLWLAQLYNDDKVLFAILVTASMGLIGLIIGNITDLILKIFGLDVSKISHNE